MASARAVSFDEAIWAVAEVVHVQTVPPELPRAVGRRRCGLTAPLDPCVAHSHHAAVATDHVQAHVGRVEVVVVASDEHVPLEVDHLRRHLKGASAADGRVAAKGVEFERWVDKHHGLRRCSRLPSQHSHLVDRDVGRG